MDNFSPPKGNISLSKEDYANLLSAQKVKLVYDVVEIFERKFVKKDKQLVERVIQVAEEGKNNLKNIAEDELVVEEEAFNEVVRVSLKKLLTEYENYLQQRSLKIWDKNAKEAADARKICRQSDDDFKLCRKVLEESLEEEFVNIAICLTHQAMSSVIKFTAKSDDSKKPNAAQNKSYEKKSFNDRAPFEKKRFNQPRSSEGSTYRSNFKAKKY